MSTDRSQNSNSVRRDGDEVRVEQIVGDYIDRLNRGERIGASDILDAHPALGHEILEHLESFTDLYSPALEPLGTLGDYTLRRQIGRGGMGVVYEAWENSMDRAVALKVLPGAVAADERALQRFVREAKVAGDLRHPNVVPVFGMGVKEDTPYYAMEYVEGETLAQVVGRVKEAEDEAETPFGPKNRQDFFVRLGAAFADVADGLQHAHSKGVTHRDIKPSNLILDGEGRIRILDFGLARLEGQASLTISGDLMGTVLYMSPEQAMAKRIPIDHRTDVYSFGATMYEALTGQPPVQGRNQQETLSEIIVRDPRPPRQYVPRIPGDLETIVLKCLRKDPRDRYGTAEALGQDLRRFVRGDPIEGRAELPWRRLSRKVARHKGRILACVLLALVGSLSGLLLYEQWSRHRADEHRRYTNELAVQKMKLLRCRTTLEAATGRSRGIDSQGFFVFTDFERLVTDAPIAEVVQALEALTREVPERFEAHFYLAQALVLTGRPQDAHAPLERALELNPTFPLAVSLQAELEGTKLARERVQESLAKHEGAEWQALWLEALIACREGRLSEAVHAYDDLIALDRDGKTDPGFSIDLHVARGLVSLEAGDFREAADDFVVAGNLWPEFLEPRLLRGKADYLGGHKEWAEAGFEDLHREWGSREELRQESSSRDEAASWIAIVYLSVGDNFRALRWAAKVEHAGSRARLRAWCALNLYGASPDTTARREKALEAARHALAVDPRDSVALLTAAVCLFWSSGPGQSERIDEVETLAEQVVALEDDHILAAALLASVYWRRGKTEEGATKRAVDLASEVGRKSRDDLLASILANRVLWIEGRNAELGAALAAQEQGLAEATPRERAYWIAVRAELLRREGKHGDAIAGFETSLALDPDPDWVRRGRCQIFFQRGDYNDAAECFGESVSRGVGGVGWLVRSLEQLERPREAVSAVCNFLAKYPWRTGVHQTLPPLVRKYGDELLPHDVERVVRTLEEASRDPKASPLLLRSLAFLRVHAPTIRDIEGARKAVVRALETGAQSDPEAHAILAEILYEEGDVAEAVRTLESALHLPRPIKAHALLLDRWRVEALPDLPSFGSIEAVLASSENPAIQENVALLEDYREVSTGIDTQRRLVYLEAILLQRKGSWAEAARRFAEVAEGGTEPEPHLRLAESLLAAGQTSEAEVYLRRILESMDDAPTDLWNLWLTVTLDELEQSPAEALGHFPRSQSAYAIDVRWLLEELGSSGVLRIDSAAKEDSTSADGSHWTRDRFAIGGGDWPTLGGGSEIHRTRRWFGEDEHRPGYAIPLPRGSYTLTLHFCESWSAAPGVRLFDVIIEGDTLLDGYDGFSRGFGVPTSEVFDEIRVEDGLLEIEFRPRKNVAAVAAIEVRSNT